METLREKVGQMFLVGCQGENLADNEQLRRLGAIAFEQDHAAKLILGEEQLLVVRERLALAADEKHLPDFLTQRLHGRPL